MKVLHGCCLMSHGLIALTHAHKCLADQGDVHAYVVAAAYVVLAVVQSIFLYFLFRKGKKNDEQTLL